jgi:hypothetical protein
MQTITPCASSLSACATAGSTFGLGAVASVFSVLWRSTSFATASVFLPAASFADADFQAIPCLGE